MRDVLIVTMQRALKRTAKKKKPLLTGRRILLIGSIAGLAITLSTKLSRWPYELAESLGLDAELGINNLLDILQTPGLIFFVFLTIYGIQTCIKEYQTSFDKPVKNRC